MDVGEWLRQLGFEQYIPAFAENAIDWSVLPSLTADDLKEIGVSAVGHRRKLLNAIATLSDAAGSETAPVPPADVAAIAPSGAERRQLTVMFCDLVGSTALATRLDPEDLRDVIGSYHIGVAEKVGRFGGYVAKYMGDGVLVYFGYPQAHEDDAERAVRAGLALAERVSLFAASETLSVRIGIATGLVVVGDLIGQGEVQERGVVGETPNLAARLQALAPPGGVLIAEATRRLLGALFEYEDLGTAELKGFAVGVRVWRVVRPSQVESRFEALRVGVAMPLIGRDEELDLLLRRWQRAAAGEGQLVLLSGEPGIGKSRLTAALQERLREAPHTRLRYFCSPHHQDSALHPFIAQLEHAAGFVREDAADAKRTKLVALLGEPDTSNAEAVGLIADLLSVPSDGRYPPLPADPQQRRAATLAALVAQLERMAEVTPVLMIFEDAHWADASSLELLDHTVEGLRRLPVLLVLTHRPEFAPQWVGQASVASIALSRLGGREAAALAANVAGGKSLPQDILDRIVERTDGIPLFIEELTKSLIEGGLLREEATGYALAGALPALAIPSSLQASLLARLDRLAPVREVAQIGAAIGREFSKELLAAVARRSEVQLAEAFDQLIAAGLVLRRGSTLQDSYVFKHALVQDAAYSTLLRGQRQELHARIAKILEERFLDTAETQPELLAHHYTEAALFESAVAYWHKAGDRASRRSANAEAAAHFRRGLNLIPHLPDHAAQLSAELKIQYALGRSLMATEGYGSKVAAEAYRRASELCEQADDREAVMRVLLGLRAVSHVSGDIDAARLHGTRCLEIAEKMGHSAFITEACASLSHTLCMSGAFIQARSQLNKITVAYRSAAPGIYQPVMGLDPEVMGLCVTGWNEWILGYPDRGLEAARQAIQVARSLNHLQSLDNSLSAAALVCLLRDDVEPAIVLADEAIAISREQGMKFRLAIAQLMRTCALSKIRQHLGNNVEQLTEGIAQYIATGGTSGYMEFFYAALSEAHQISGNLCEAIRTMDEVRSKVRTKWWTAELHRAEGDLLLAQHQTGQAEHSYWTAIETAHQQQAVSWKLRAATSLARLWHDQGKRAEARELLFPIYSWFTEGFDTADLKAAKALLDDFG